MSTSTGPDTTGTPTTGTGTSLELTTGAAGTTSASSTSAATTDAGTTTADTTGTTTTDPGTTAATEPASTCDGAAVNVLLLAGDAVAVAPMMRLMSMLREGTIAASEVAEQGTIAFTAQLPCGDSYAVWGRVIDPIPGVQTSHLDSPYIHR